MRSYQQFFAELKRRHVFKVAAIYGATAFVILQLADLLVQGLKLPTDFLSMITVLVLLGLPVALILAWAFQMTAEGVRRTDAASDEEIEAIVAQPASKRWPAGLLALAGVAALVAGAWWVGRQTAPGGEADTDARSGDTRSGGAPRLAYEDLRGDSRPSIAVLPFADMSREGDQEYFSDGMTEEILNTLANVRDLRVSGRTSTFAYKDQDKDLRQIGKELGVHYIVEGSVRKDGDNLRITAQLINAADGSHLWSEQYDRTLESVFAVQSEIAGSIADALRVPLGLADPAELVTAAADFDAYDLYLAARSRMRERGVSINEAIRLYEAAIAVDSVWAPAWAGLAEAREISLWYVEGWGGEQPTPEQVTEQLTAAERAARRAIALDPENASAHVALGSVLRDRYEWTEAEASYRRALALDPDDAEAHQQYAEMLYAIGRIEEGVREADRAAALDPAPVRFNVLATALRMDDRSDVARRAYERGIELDPDVSHLGLRRGLGRLHYQAGRYDRAWEYWSAVDPELASREEEYREFTGWLRQGTIAALPDSVHDDLDPREWMMIGEPDSAAASLTDLPRGLEFSWLQYFWDPQFDPIRRHPLVRSFLEERNIHDLTARRTPPENRRTPGVLRDVAEE